MEYRVIMKKTTTKLYEANRNKIITQLLLQYESAVIHRWVLLKFLISKNLPKIAMTNKFSFILKMYIF